jgi:hypothetical protein
LRGRLTGLQFLQLTDLPIVVVYYYYSQSATRTISPYTSQHLVNLSFVAHLFKPGGGYIVLENGERLALPKSKKDGLMERLELKKG